MTSNGCEPDAVTYRTLISGLCKAGRVEIAGKLLRTVKMKGMSVAPQSYNPIIQALFKRQRTEEAMRLFREMMKNAEAPDAVTYKIVFRGLCCGGGPIKEAIDFMVEMTEKGYLPEFSSFSMLAEGLCALSMEDTLVKLVDQVMKKANFSASELSMVMGFLKIRKFQDALATFDRLLSSRKPRKLYRYLRLEIPYGILRQGICSQLFGSFLAGKGAMQLFKAGIKGLLQGVAAHHTGCLPLWKSFIEQLFLKGLVKIVFATETLAAGINMPARTAVITSLSKRNETGRIQLCSSELLQMAGRAGRRGTDDRGHVVLIQTPYEGAEEGCKLFYGAKVTRGLKDKDDSKVSQAGRTLEEARKLVEQSFGNYVGSITGTQSNTERD
ncbi:hypothetical protein IFM89_012703 [Coptis chinensis]|uniref:Helicase C-terminal domain-containing protein n=1 Tax=Coptis chinensis TaxID=261450 RepID=A0A835IXW4_9MAGN|nr:hypothetical protein IFM89_012703 [Coptis chinensis]